MTTWLMVDANNLAWRAHHALNGLNHEGAHTDVIFGFLRDLIHFKGKFKADSCVICFDRGKSLRTKTFPGYKANRARGEMDPLRLMELQSVKDQLGELEEHILPDVGFKNVLSQEGYEADDLIASVCYDCLLPNDEAVIVGNDRDLLQLLSGQVSIWNFRKHVTLQSFHAEWKLEPKQWADVKALAGCPTDGIQGIKGVGEITAAKFLRDGLKVGKTLDRIASPEGIIMWDRNRKLVELPWPGLKQFLLYYDEPDPDAWDRICERYGMDSLLGMLQGRKGMVK